MKNQLEGGIIDESMNDEDRDFEEETLLRQEEAYKKLLASIPPMPQQ